MSDAIPRAKAVTQLAWMPILAGWVHSETTYLSRRFSRRILDARGQSSRDGNLERPSLSMRIVILQPGEPKMTAYCADIRPSTRCYSIPASGSGVVYNTPNPNCYITAHSTPIAAWRLYPRHVKVVPMKSCADSTVLILPTTTLRMWLSTNVLRRLLEAGTAHEDSTRSRH